MNLNNVYMKIYDEDIKIFPFGVDGLKAVTIESEGNYGIFLNKKEIENSDEEFCVLAHEYGHCTSGTTHKLYSPFDIVCRHEFKADRKSVLEFLPVDEIKKAIDNNCQTPHEIASFLDLPEIFVRKAIMHYSCMGDI